MGKKRRRKKVNNREVVNVFGSSNSDSSNDTKSQVSLAIGSEAYEDFKEGLQAEQKKKSGEEEFHAELEVDNRGLRTRQLEKENIANAYNATGQKKYRRFMSKEVQVKPMKKIIEDGLDRRIPRKDFNDELYDDGISGDEFGKEAARDYRNELNDLLDTNKDGQVDSSDEPMTPAERRLYKYM